MKKAAAAAAAAATAYMKFEEERAAVLGEQRSWTELADAAATTPVLMLQLTVVR